MKRAPLIINEATIDRHVRIDPTTGEKVEDEALSSLRDAALRARLAVDEISSSHIRIMKNPMQTELRNAQLSRAAAWRHVEATTKLMDAAIQRAHQSISELQAAMALPKAKDAMLAIAYSDIRRGIAASRPNKRRSTIQLAVERGDADIIAAVCAITPIASGIDASEMEMVVLNWNRKHHPEKLDRIKRLENASADVYEMGQGLQAWANGLTDGEAIKRAEASERAARVTAR